MQAYIRYTKFVLVFVFVVILAGGLVRMTQSGMGCPDWPTCFGKWIPPTNANQLPPDFEKYLKQQDIDHTFNVYHTWIEYLNRLAGALLGLFILVHVVYSFKLFFRNRPSIFWWSLGLLLLTGFQGWLGKKVVDHNLAVVKITIHMLVAIVIAAIPLVIIHLVQQQQKVKNSTLKVITTLALFLVLIQIILGTEVREQIDIISKELLYTNRFLWIAKLDGYFTIHKLFSIIVSGICIYIFFNALSAKSLHKPAFWVLFTVLGSVMLGLLMAYNNIPAFAQPTHLLLSSVLVTALLGLRLNVK